MRAELDRQSGSHLWFDRRGDGVVQIDGDLNLIELAEAVIREPQIVAAHAAATERPDHRTAADREGEQLHGLTGIFDRAIGQDGRWGTYDIAELDRASLIDFVRGRGEVSTWALHIVLIMLGHDREGVE